MASILDTLAARYFIETDNGNGEFVRTPIAVQIGVRRESGLSPPQIGETNLETMDAYVLRRLQARASRLEGVLTQAAGGGRVWPWTQNDLAAAYPQLSQAQRDNILRLQLETAADAVAAGVLGDLFARAAPRDESYRDSRNFYIGDPSDRADVGEAGRLARDVLQMVSGAAQIDAQAVRNLIVAVALNDGEDVTRTEKTLFRECAHDPYAGLN